MTALRLYKVADDLLPLLDQVDEDGCMSPELGEALSKFEGKGLSVTAYILNLDATIQAAREAAAKMAKRAELMEKRAERLRNYLALNMKLTGITEISCAEFSAKLLIERDAAVEITNAAQIPLEYMRTPEPKPPVPAPDKKAIAAAIKSGKEVPGARIVKSDRLEIK